MCLHSCKPLTQPDRLDLLLRLAATGQPPRLCRLVCSPQGAPQFARVAAHLQRLHEPPRDPGQQPGTPDVHLRSAQWFRDLLARFRLPRRPSRRPRPKLIRAPVWRLGHEQFGNPRQRRAPTRSLNRIPLPCEGHLQLRSEPRRRKRDQLPEARYPRSLRRQRAMVASKEAKWRDGHCAQQLPHLAVKGDWFSARFNDLATTLLLCCVSCIHGLLGLISRTIDCITIDPVPLLRWSCDNWSSSG
jgi:hypothetical protein